MRWRNTIICLVCLIGAAALLYVAAGRLDYINSQRKEMNLVANKPLENAPPSLAFTTAAMGAFRGLVVDVLWMRAEKLKEQGQFFDAKQLAEWITILQPRFAKVWEYQAWNMAYNISVAIPSTHPDQRWLWVKNGYELLRDKGIPLNPHSILLYRELAMIFQHKIGGITDEAHRYYKLRLVDAMEPLVGGADKEYFLGLIDAPKKFTTISNDPNVSPFIEDLRGADPNFAENETFVSNYLSLRSNPDRFKEEAFRVIDNYRGTAALRQFDLFAKAYQLRNEWKLDPSFMHELNKKYGPVDWNDPNRYIPLDWRNADTHAIYWAIKGLQNAGDKEYSIDKANTDRIVVHSLGNLFRHGQIYIYNISDQSPKLAKRPRAPLILKKNIYLRPDLRMFDRFEKARAALVKKYKPLNKATYISMKKGHENVLKTSVLLFWQAGHKKQASKIFNQLKETYPCDEYNVTAREFSQRRLATQFESPTLNEAREVVHALLQESYFRYAMRDDDAAYGREKMAKEMYNHYQTSWSDENRIDLPDFGLLRYFALVDFLTDEKYLPELRNSLLDRIRIERPELAVKLEKSHEEIMKEFEQAQK